MLLLVVGRNHFSRCISQRLQRIAFDVVEVAGNNQ